jgi:hypothetical protein
MVSLVELKQIAREVVAERDSLQPEFALCATDFWHFAQYVQTHDEDDEGKIRSLPLDWPFLHEIVTQLNNDDPVVVIPKSRRMMVTTVVAAWIDWKMIFTDQSIGDLWSSCLVSINEKKAKKFVERVVGIHELLPDFLRKPWKNSTQLDRSIDNGGSLEAIHAGGSGPRSEGYAVGIMDECAFQANARENFSALRQCARKTILISSANGRGNLFDEKWDDATVNLLELHYSRHPMRVPGTEIGDAWKQRAMVGQSRADWLREQEMDRDVYATAGYYGSDWTRDVVREIDWDGKGIVTIGMDYSYKHPAAMVSYLNEYEQWCRMYEYLHADTTLERFLPIVFGETLRQFKGAKYRVGPDPYRGRQTKGDQDAWGNPATDLATIERYAKQILGQDTIVGTSVTGSMHVPEGHRRVRRLFVMREDGRYGTIIHPRCKNLIQGFSGAYGPSENATENQLANEEPDKERLQVHVMDADRYGVCEFVHEDLGLSFTSKRTDSSQLAQRAALRALQERLARGVV